MLQSALFSNFHYIVIVILSHIDCLITPFVFVAMTMATTKNVEAERQLSKQAHQFMLQHEVSLHAEQPQGLGNCKKDCIKCNVTEVSINCFCVC